MVSFVNHVHYPAGLVSARIVAKAINECVA